MRFIAANSGDWNNLTRLFIYLFIYFSEAACSFRFWTRYARSYLDNVDVYFGHKDWKSMCWYKQSCQSSTINNVKGELMNMEFSATLNFRKFKVALNSIYRIF